MKTSFSPLLQKLNEDYKINAGKPFEHFFCPILHVDEDVELCKGHILNRSLKGVNRTVTVQRKDVDGFFGTMFEDDARNIEIYHQKQLHEIVFDSFLSKRFNSRIYAEGEVVDTFFSSGPFPDHATPIVFAQEQIAIDANSDKRSLLMALNSGSD